MPPESNDYDPTGIELHKISAFRFANGTTLQDVKVAYREFNKTSTAGTVLIPTCFGGWINNTLSFMEAPNDALAQYHVVVVAMLGNGESSSPSNKPFFPEPGELHYEDMIRSQYHLLTEGLAVEQLEAVVGFSMGGQQAYYWPVMYPNFVKRMVSICSSARTSPHNYTFLEGPISALTNSIDYIAWKQIKTQSAVGENVGQNLSQVKPMRGLSAFSRAYSAWLTSADWFRQRLWHTTLGFTSVEAWIESSCQEDRGWDADDLLVLARMWQMGDIGAAARGALGSLSWASGKDDRNLEYALGQIKCPVLLMPCSTDQYFRPEDNEDEVKHLKHGTLAVIESVWGHTSGGGLCREDTLFMSEKIKEFMRRS